MKGQLIPGIKTLKRRLRRSHGVLLAYIVAIALSIFVAGLLSVAPTRLAHGDVMPVVAPEFATAPAVTEKTGTKASKRTMNFRRYLIMKRWIDIVGAGVLLIVLSPLMLIIVILVKLDSPGPAIFDQTRVGSRVRGKGGKRSWEMTAFTVHKFRTMYHNVDSAPHRAFVQAFIQKDMQTLSAIQGSATEAGSHYKLAHDSRITPIGKFLRKTSLDELPQLWNVFKGEMSLVGPRPAIPYEVEIYSPAHLRRLQAKPGLTGVWQVTSRSSVDFDGMVDLDVWYIDHQSLVLDLKLIAKTPFSVMRGKGAV